MRKKVAANQRAVVIRDLRRQVWSAFLKPPFGEFPDGKRLTLRPWPRSVGRMYSMPVRRAPRAVGDLSLSPRQERAGRGL